MEHPVADTPPTLDDLMGDDEPEMKPLLSAAEVSKARKDAADRVEKEMKKVEIDRIIAEEMAIIKREAGKRTGVADMDEKVSIMVDLPEFCPSININGERFWHGHTYTLPRHIANGLREIMSRANNHQLILDGKGTAERYRKAAPMMVTPNGNVPVLEGVL